MRRILHRHRWATLAVTVLLLFATSGMALSRMTCLMGGHTVWAFGMLDDCCPEAEATDGAAITAECCVYGQAGGNVLPFVPAQELAVGQPYFDLVSFSGTRDLLLEHAHIVDPITGPPPISGSQRLVAHRTFRI